MQQLLPFRHLHIPPKHVAWLATANAGNFSEKKGVFYPFKTRFLRQHALTDGMDLQIIVLKCYCGDGIWRGIDHQLPKRLHEVCNKCDGTGIYATKRIVLIRWMLQGQIFHEPSNLIFHHPGNEYRETINGKITHPEVPERAARRAMEKLMLRYDPAAFYELWMRRWRNWQYYRQQHLKRIISTQMRRVNQLLAKPKEEEIPF